MSAKKVAAGFLAVGCLLAALLFGLVLVGTLRQERLRNLPPLTLQEVDQISKSLRKTDAAASAAAEGKRPLPQPSAQAPADNNTRRASLACRLKRPPTDEERRAQFTQDRSLRNKAVALMGSSPLGGFVDALCVGAGIPGGALSERGECFMRRGNWAEAKRCYTEFVRTSKDPVMLPVAYGCLAWLEEDPELRARYMELACTGDGPGSFALVRNLAQATGSYDLAEYYERLRQERLKGKQDSGQ